MTGEIYTVTKHHTIKPVVLHYHNSRTNHYRGSNPREKIHREHADALPPVYADTI